MTGAIAQQLGILVGESLLVATLLITLFRLRTWFGLSLLYVAIGVFQPIQVQLSGAVYVEFLPGVVASPGSIVLFTGSLFAVLLVYIREDAIETRKVIYGLVAANLTSSLLYLLYELHLGVPTTQNVHGIPTALYAQQARITIAGTFALLVDAILVPIVYEAVRRVVRRPVSLRIWLAMAIVLAVDSVVFSVGAFLGEPQLLDVLVSGAIGKILLAVIYATCLTAYLRWVEPERLPHDGSLRDVFHALTYREKFERERANASAALRERDERQRAVLDAAADGILAVGPDGRIVEANRATSEAFGLDRDRLIGTPFDELLSPSTRDTARAVLAPVFDGSAPRCAPTEVGARRADGSEFPAEFDGAALEFGGSRFVIVSLRDVTARARLQEQFMQAQKLESVGRLAGGIAHDFNNLLTVIVGQTDLLQRRIAGDPAASVHVAALQQAAERATALTSQLLAFARKQVLAPKVLDLNDTIRTTEGMLRRLIGEDVVLSTRLDAELFAVRASPDLIANVLVNLVVNARDAMPEGGALVIETANFRGVPSDASFVGDPPYGDYATVVVRDTGHGIGADVLPYVFEPFFTTKEPGKGTGLGLSTCYGVVRQSGGHISICTRVGKGTAVTVFLPRVDPAGGPTSVPRREQDAELAGRESVLIVEDDEFVLSIARSLLTERGYRVRTARSGEQAMRVAADATLDLLITDLVMPGLRGSQLAMQLTQRHPHLAVLYMTGYPYDPARDGQHNARVLRKPFTSEQLASAVRAALEARPVRR